MRTMKTSEAAALPNVGPNTLRAWERRFDHPKPQRSAGRLYTHGEVAAPRDAREDAAARPLRDAARLALREAQA